jgi:predicted Fe-S protein YdhL (DUF1289 family)
MSGDPFENMQPIDTPCKKICTLHPQLQLCTGCGRTLSEIERWTALSDAERTGVMQVAKDRLAALDNAMDKLDGPLSSFAVGNS